LSLLLNRLVSMFVKVNYVIRYTVVVTVKKCANVFINSKCSIKIKCVKYIAELLFSSNY